MISNASRNTHYGCWNLDGNSYRSKVVLYICSYYLFPQTLVNPKGSHFYSSTMTWPNYWWSSKAKWMTSALPERQKRRNWWKICHPLLLVSHLARRPANRPINRHHRVRRNYVDEKRFLEFFRFQLLELGISIHKQCYMYIPLLQSKMRPVCVVSSSVQDSKDSSYFTGHQMSR